MWLTAGFSSVVPWDCSIQKIPSAHNMKVRDVRKNIILFPFRLAISGLLASIWLREEYRRNDDTRMNRLHANALHERWYFCIA